jgi:hypothetical protein
MATPFEEDGTLDVAGIPRFVERAIETGIRGFAVLGIAGEAHRLTDEERRHVVDGVVKEVAGRRPVLVGVSAGGTRLATAVARMARDHGANAAMVAPPNGVRNRHPRDGIHDRRGCRPHRRQTLDARRPAPYLSAMADGSAMLPDDPTTAAAIAALRSRIAERIAAIMDDLETIHRTIDAARPLTHSAEDFEALEALDTETWEALDALRGMIARSGFLERGNTP